MRNPCDKVWPSCLRVRGGRFPHFCDADDGDLTRAEKTALTRKRNQTAQVMDDLASEPTGKHNDMWRYIERTILPSC